MSETSRLEAEKFELKFALDTALGELQKFSAQRMEIEERLNETSARLTAALESNTNLKRKLYAAEAASDEVICILSASKQHKSSQPAAAESPPQKSKDEPAEPKDLEKNRRQPAEDPVYPTPLKSKDDTTRRGMISEIIGITRRWIDRDERNGFEIRLAEKSISYATDILKKQHMFVIELESEKCRISLHCIKVW